MTSTFNLTPTNWTPDSRTDYVAAALVDAVHQANREISRAERELETLREEVTAREQALAIAVEARRQIADELLAHDTRRAAGPVDETVETIR